MTNLIKKEIQKEIKRLENDLDLYERVFFNTQSIEEISRAEGDIITCKNEIEKLQKRLESLADKEVTIKDILKVV